MNLHKQLIFYICLLLFITIMAACSQEIKQNAESTKEKTSEQAKGDTNKTNNNNENADLEVEPLPSTYQELAELPVGEYANAEFPFQDEEKILEMFADLPEISASPSQKEMDYFYRELLKKYKINFTARKKQSIRSVFRQLVIRKWKTQGINLKQI
ncbi:hypothetical protein J9303_12410 [Bacillaceae bacterium Marseille-Q3522]|nr:hypothetical protein [Bacillaceae bacterium Marseille-Q3522]